MAVSLYDISVGSYLQVLGGVAKFLDKGASFLEEKGIDPQEIVAMSLHPDMRPFQFQLKSVAHHSAGAIRGIREGLFSPPPTTPDLDYAGLISLVKDAESELRNQSREEIDAMAGKQVIFRLSRGEIPFNAENFVLSFSLPNLYFHATTAYDLLRMKGAPLGKLDYLGDLRTDQ
ncbi:MAG: DUF1993 domain-containing protein [Halioglobus sp.]|jgi:uncharacterized protein